MATLYLTEQGAVARRVGERVVVTHGERVVADIPLLKINQVRVVGRGVTLTSALLAYLMEHGIDTVFYSSRQRFRGRLSGRASGQGTLRIQQVQAATDATRALDLARAIVDGKVTNQRFVLRRHGARDPRVAGAMAGIATMRAAAARVATLDELRGLEGQAAAFYFSGFRRLLIHDLGFHGRVRRPPTDPVNALLSFGYTLLLDDVISAVSLVGLDPYIGVFHAPGPGRPALALDLMEEFRSLLVDAPMLALVNAGMVGAADMRAGEGLDHAVLLGDRLRTDVLRRHAERLATTVRYPPTGERTTYRRVIELQTRALAHACASGGPYRAYTAQ